MAIVIASEIVKYTAEEGVTISRVSTTVFLFPLFLGNTGRNNTGVENSITGIVIGSVGGVLAAIAMIWCVVITIVCLIKNQRCCCCWDDKEDEIGEYNASHTEDTCHCPYIYFNPLPTFFF